MLIQELTEKASSHPIIATISLMLVSNLISICLNLSEKWKANTDVWDLIIHTPALFIGGQKAKIPRKLENGGREDFIYFQMLLKELFEDGEHVSG
jgi:hypothetical protein